VFKLTDENKELVKQLKTLNESIEVLSKITAVNIFKEEIFKDKTKKEDRIEILTKMGLPRNLIAIVVGSTPESVSAFKSMGKPKKEPNNSQKEKKTEQVQK
jgi:hypothetical protein